MCGRFVQDQPTEHIIHRFGIADRGDVPELPARYNVPPTRPAYVVGYNPKEHRRGLAVMSWGLVPRWWKKSLKEAHRPINATAEGIAEKPTFREPFRSKRCLVPVSGFYEWEKRSGTKVPHLFRPVGDDCFALAGVWDYWPEEKLFTFAVVTTTPNAVVEPLHDRMPVVLSPEAWEAWLDPSTPLEEVKALLRPSPAERMTVYPVSRLVNSPKNDGPELVAPAA